MQSLTINVHNEQLFSKVMWLLEHFKQEGLEIVDREDMSDLKLLADTRHEETMSFDEYLKHAH
jgi:hypothetical protein